MRTCAAQRENGVGRMPAAWRRLISGSNHRSKAFCRTVSVISVVHVAGAAESVTTAPRVGNIAGSIASCEEVLSILSIYPRGSAFRMPGWRTTPALLTHSGRWETLLDAAPEVAQAFLK